MPCQLCALHANLTPSFTLVRPAVRVRAQWRRARGLLIGVVPVVQYWAPRKAHRCWTGDLRLGNTHSHLLAIAPVVIDNGKPSSNVLVKIPGQVARHDNRAPRNVPRWLPRRQHGRRSRWWRWAWWRIRARRRTVLPTRLGRCQAASEVSRLAHGLPHTVQSEYALAGTA